MPMWVIPPISSMNERTQNNNRTQNNYLCITQTVVLCWTRTDSTIVHYIDGTMSEATALNARH